MAVMVGVPFSLVRLALSPAGRLRITRAVNMRVMCLNCRRIRADDVNTRRP